jgi:hypothetical protein
MHEYISQIIHDRYHVFLFANADQDFMTTKYQKKHFQIEEKKNLMAETIIKKMMRTLPHLSTIIEQKTTHA